VIHPSTAIVEAMGFQPVRCAFRRHSERAARGPRGRLGDLAGRSEAPVFQVQRAAETSHVSLPVSKPTRVIFECVRTVTSVLVVLLNAIVLLRVYGAL
jgi:hypothetical protein